MGSCFISFILSPLSHLTSVLSPRTSNWLCGSSRNTSAPSVARSSTMNSWKVTTSLLGVKEDGRS